jgi:hypothetical protein
MVFELEVGLPMVLVEAAGSLRLSSESELFEEVEEVELD